MKKQEQLEINSYVKFIADSHTPVFERHIKMRTNDKYFSKIGRLYTCTAEIYRCGNILALKSYNTIIAFVIIGSNKIELIDALRYVYGYTSTSAQHIAKFRNWLRENLIVIGDELTYREV